MKRSVERILNWSVVIIGIIGTLYFTGVLSSRHNNTHVNGEESIGIVIRKHSGKSVESGTGSQGITFVFNQDGKWIRGNFYGPDYYEKAIVGMKYKVKYIPEETKDSVINHSANIYIDEPIVSEYPNIQSTREWILTHFFPDRKEIPGARDLSEINHMLPNSLKEIGNRNR